MRSILFHSSSQKMALCILWTVFLSANILSAQAVEIQQKRFMSVRFDPSYYYNREESIEKLCRDQAVLWRQSGMNAVYIKVYDPVYGAVYKTRYAPNIETDYGRINFLRTFIDACHGEELQVYAWIPAYQHKQVWEMHPDWRVKRSDGSDYKPGPDSYLLCVRNPDYREWCAGFLNELLKNYPDLDGVDIAEPVVIWTAGEGCYCDVCRPDVSALSARQGMDQKRAYEL